MTSPNMYDAAPELPAGVAYVHVGHGLRVHVARLTPGLGRTSCGITISRDNAAPLGRLTPIGTPVVRNGDVCRTCAGLWYQLSLSVLGLGG